MKQSLNQDVNIPKTLERNIDEFIENDTKYKSRFQKINISKTVESNTEEFIANDTELKIHLKASNYLVNYTRTACKVCGKIVNINGVRAHIKKEHVREIIEYY